MSYVQPLRVTYSFPIATSAITLPIKTPRNCSNVRVADINASVTTTYNAGTSAAKIEVGVSGNLDVLGYVSLGTTAGGAAVGWSASYKKGTNPTYGALDLTGTSNTISGSPTTPEVLGPVLITFVANVDGGGEAGAGYADVTLEWF